MNRCTLSAALAALSLLACLAPAASARAAVTCTGVPDGFGYTCAPDPGAWQNVATSLVRHDDDHGVAVALPFDFTFYGVSYRTVCIDSNGYLELGCSSAVSDPVSDPIPTVSTPNGAVYVFWADLDPDAGGQIKYGTLGTAPNRRFVVSWEGVAMQRPGTAIWAQGILEEGGDVVIRHQDAQWAPVYAGIEDASGTRGYQAVSPDYTAPPHPAAYRFHVNPLVAEASPLNVPYFSVEGASPTLTGRASGGFPPYSYAWDVDGDGRFETLGQRASVSLAGVDGPTNHPVLLQVIDSYGFVARDTATIFVGNVAPVVSGTPPPDVVAGRLFEHVATASDPGGDTVRFSLVQSPAGMTLASAQLAGGAAEARLSWTPPEAQIGMHTIVLRATDDDGATAEQRFDVFVDPALAIVPGGPYEATEGTFVDLDATASGGRGTWRVTWDLDGDGTFEAAGPRARILVHDGPATLQVPVRVADGEGYTAEASATITVQNVPPAFTSTPPLRATAGVAWAYDATSTDPAGFHWDMPLYELLTAPSGMTAIGAMLRWTPAAAQVGVHTVVLRVEDGDGASADQVFALEVVLPDGDGDGVPDSRDVCPTLADPGQGDADGDGRGDACDPCPADPVDDEDQDGVCGDVDLCPQVADPEQPDRDGDGRGDACDPCPADPADDQDRDGVCGDVDLCPQVADAEQADRDGDGAGDACDPCPADPEDDEDRDGVCGELDLCPQVADPEQADRDGDGAGDLCDDDLDGDGVANASDLCPGVPDPEQGDLDADGAGDVCDDDRDGDGLGNALEAELGLDEGSPDSDGDTVSDGDEVGEVAEGGEAPDSDGDGVSDALDDDSDGDGVLDLDEAGDGELATPPVDHDGDGVTDRLDLDSDGDGVEDGADVCRLVADPAQADGDADGLGDSCDGDADGDGVEDSRDLCPGIADPDQSDADGDGSGDACDGDADGDGVEDSRDVCPGVVDPEQVDADRDGIGAACDEDDRPRGPLELDGAARPGVAPVGHVDAAAGAQAPLAAGAAGAAGGAGSVGELDGSGGTGGMGSGAELDGTNGAGAELDGGSGAGAEPDTSGELEPTGAGDGDEAPAAPPPPGADEGGGCSTAPGGTSLAGLALALALAVRRRRS